MSDERSIHELRVKALETDALPTLPGIAQRLLSIDLDADEGENEFLSVVESDPVIGARLIGLANSAFFAPKKKILSIRDAILFLGFAKVKAISLGIALLSPLHVRQCKVFSFKKLWLHSFSMATGMRALCHLLPRNQRPPEEIVFLSGLLHDIGYLALAYISPGKFDEFLIEAESNLDTPIAELELNISGISHAELGEILAKNWHLPEEIAAVIAGHHGYKIPDEHQTLVMLARLTESILDHNIIREEVTSQESIVAILEMMGLSANDLGQVSQVLREQQEQIEVLADMLGN